MISDGLCALPSAPPCIICYTPLPEQQTLHMFHLNNGIGNSSTYQWCFLPRQVSLTSAWTLLAHGSLGVKKRVLHAGKAAWHAASKQWCL